MSSKKTQELAEKVKELSPEGQSLVKAIVTGDVDEIISVENADAGIVISLEELIKATVTNMDNLKRDIKKISDQVKDTCNNDPLYHDKDEIVKNAQKVRADVKARIMSNPANKTLDKKLKEMRADLREKKFSLSEYLKEYKRLTQANQLELDFGEVLEIVETVKVIKKNK